MDTVRLGIIGMGNMGKYHADSLLKCEISRCELDRFLVCVLYHEARKREKPMTDCGSINAPRSKDGHLEGSRSLEMRRCGAAPRPLEPERRFPKVDQRPPGRFEALRTSRIGR